MRSFLNILLARRLAFLNIFAGTSHFDATWPQACVEEDDKALHSVIDQNKDLHTCKRHFSVDTKRGCNIFLNILSFFGEPPATGHLEETGKLKNSSQQFTLAKLKWVMEHQISRYNSVARPRVSSGIHIAWKTPGLDCPLSLYHSHTNTTKGWFTLGSESRVED